MQASGKQANGDANKGFSLFRLILEAMKCINALCYGTFQPFYFYFLFFICSFFAGKSESCFREDIREKRASFIE